MVYWQRLTVHAERYQSISTIKGEFGWESAGPTVMGGHRNLFSSGGQSCLLKKFRQRHTEKHRSGDEVASHLIGHATERHHSFDDVTVEEVLVGE